MDFEGSGCQSSVEEVWRTSKFSPGAVAVPMLRSFIDLTADWVSIFLVSTEYDMSVAIRIGGASIYQPLVDIEASAAV
jgi:hypothetical protein